MTDIAGLIERLPDGMTQHEYEVLRILNGEDVPGWVAGAGMWACCSWLKGRGYAQGHYEISDKGRALLRTLETTNG
jgi:hypothetical protein